MLQKIVRRFSLITWTFWERLGLHLSPNHFYWPIPDSRELEAYEFDAHFENDGIEIDKQRMLGLLTEIAKFRDEYLKIHQRTGFSSNGDGALLYGMVRRIAPQHVIEVGAGHSTAIIRAALNQNDASADRSSAMMTSIEPFPSVELLRTVDENSKVNRLIVDKVQSVPLSVFRELKRNDILFIDSSHVAAIGSDVQFLYLRVLPCLAPGVFVHIHDIRYPQDYPRDWVLEGRKYWNEQYLLQAFLAFNSSFEVVFAANYIYQHHPKEMEAALVDLPSSKGGWPGSFWIRRLP